MFRRQGFRMASFKKHFREIFDTLGYPLTDRAGLPSKVLVETEKRLGAKIPMALRDYYLVAGRERRFNTCHNRLLAPQKCMIDHQKLIFMKENQTVVWWSVSTRNPDSNDPPVFQGANDKPIAWVREHRKCSTFLTVMLHYQAVSGGFRFFGSTGSPDNVHELLKRGWNYAGELNQLWAFNRQNQVVCVTPGGGLPFMPAMILRAGGKTRNDMRSIEESLLVTLK
jgi:hypothetical protein